jgi:hypothetical protein
MMVSLQGPAARAGDPIVAEPAGDRSRRLAAGELPEDAPDDLRLGYIDPPAAMDRLAPGVVLADDVIAVAEPATRAALADSTFQPAMSLGGEVLEEEGVHRALEPDMELADLALSQGQDPDTVEAELLVEASDILLVA